MIPIVSTKLNIPPSRPGIVVRPRLTERLNDGLHRKLTLLSASTGFGKTTLVSEWLAECSRPVAWLSLDEGDNDAARFLSGLLAALQSIGVTIGEGVFGLLRASHSPPIDSIMTSILQSIIAYSNPCILVLDDCHVVEDASVDRALALLVELMPRTMHLVITTRHDPRLPLPIMRVRDQLTELRADDLRFTHSEADQFLNEVMGLQLELHSVTLLEERTEGWIAGLQLAALSLQGQQDAASIIQSFSGSHRFVLDYLMEEVLRKQSEAVQSFLLCTSILDRLCGPLCSAVMGEGDDMTGTDTLAYLERANLFLVPLDHERRWYRYHHLFAELLRQRMQQSSTAQNTAEWHSRASRWYEDNGLDVEAFRHAAAAGDIDRAARLIEGGGLPLHFRGVMSPVLHWLNSLKQSDLAARPPLCVMYASVLLMAGQVNGTELMLRIAESALDGMQDPDDDVRDLIGHIAAIKATIAVSRQQAETIIAQSNRALAYLRQDNLAVRTSTIWTLGCAYELQGDRPAASRAFAEAASVSKVIGHVLIHVLSMIGLGSVQASENQPELAESTFRHALELAGEPPIPVACEAHLGLARIYYEWDDRRQAEHHGQLSLLLARQLENTDRFIACELFMARLALASGRTADAAALLARSEHSIKQHQFVNRMQDLAEVQVLLLLRQGDCEAAEALAKQHGLPMSEARVRLAKGDAKGALVLITRMRDQAEQHGWADIRLRSIVLQAIAQSRLSANLDHALQLLGDALAIGGPAGFVRTFTDEGNTMAGLLAEAAARDIMPDYAGKLLISFDATVAAYSDSSSNPYKSRLPEQLKQPKQPEQQEQQEQQGRRQPLLVQPLIEPLSERELEVLGLIASGRSNREICDQLFLALSTVKGYNQSIFDKLQVKRRTEAVARARELGII